MENKKNQLLQGKINYLPWSTRLETLLTIDDIVTRVGTKLQISGEDDAQRSINEKKGKKYIIQNCDDSVMHSISPLETFDQTLTKLNSAYGYGNMDPSLILNQLRSVKFHPQKDPSIELNEIDLRLAELESAGGSIADSQVVQYIHDGLSGDALRDNFWFNCKGHLSMAKLSTFTVETIGQYIVRFWYSYKSKSYSDSSHFVYSKPKYEKRFCQFCQDANRKNIMKTHNSADCRLKTNDNDVFENANKASFPFPHCSNNLYHDSGTSITMMRNQLHNTTDKRLNIPVFTAGATQKPEIAVAQGTIQLGNLNINALQVPSFSKNLLSATQLSLDYGCTQIIEPWNL